MTYFTKVAFLTCLALATTARADYPEGEIELTHHAHVNGSDYFRWRVEGNWSQWHWEDPETGELDPQTDTLQEFRLSRRLVRYIRAAAAAQRKSAYGHSFSVEVTELPGDRVIIKFGG